MLSQLNVFTVLSHAVEHCLVTGTFNKGRAQTSLLDDNTVPPETLHCCP